MEKLIDLLKRWAELEPERCEQHDAVFTLDIGYVHTISPITDFEKLLIQGAAQQAIEARGDLEVEIHYMNGRGGWWYVIVKSDDRRRKWKTDDKLLSVALLAAYLQAIEATAEVGG